MKKLQHLLCALALCLAFEATALADDGVVIIGGDRTPPPPPPPAPTQSAQPSAADLLLIWLASLLVKP